MPTVCCSIATPSTLAIAATLTIAKCSKAVSGSLLSSPTGSVCSLLLLLLLPQA
jgi:hypothetical protein